MAVSVAIKAAMRNINNKAVIKDEEQVSLV